MRTLVMGVLNVTPDSFSDGGRWLSHESAVARGREMFSQGADFVDVGGESTRPGAQPVATEEELARVIPVVRELATVGRVSIDTMKSEVASAAVRAGASLLNDVSASLYQVAADEGVAWVAMHMQGEPRTMQAKPAYTDVAREVSEFLFGRAEQAKQSGVSEVWIDPGIGFGKTVAHNLELLRRLEVLTTSSYPVVLGTSRKTFIGAVLSEGESPAPVEDRLEGSLATAAWAVTQGVSMVRVHDVKETARVVRMLAAVQEAA